MRAQLDSCAASEELRVHELAYLLSILVGVHHATRLSRAVVAALEEGIEETWYEKKLRRQFRAN